MKHTTKIAAILFCALFLFSCVPSPEQKEVQGENSPSDAAIPENATNDPMRDNIPELDFGGYEYRVLVGEFATFTSDFYPESEMGEVLSDAFYRRNKKIEERFNIVLKTNSIDVFGCLQLMKNNVSAGSDAYDMYMQITRDAYSLSAEHMLYPIGELPNVDLAKPYWCRTANERLSVGGRQYVAFSDEMLSFFEGAVVVYFNKKQMQDLGLDNFYELVRGGTWTHDRFFEYARQAAKDIDGDGKFKKEDNWGILSESDYLFTTFWNSAGHYMVDKDKDDIPYFAVPGKQVFFDIASKVLQEVKSADGIFMNGFVQKFPGYPAASGREMRVPYFADGHGLFGVGAIAEMKELRGMQDDFGVLPFPKHTESQPQYYTRVCGGFPFVIPTTNQRPDIAGAMMESMACETRVTVIPAHYESSLKNKFSRDIDTVEMLDLIFDTRVYDLGDTVWFDSISAGYMQVFASGKDTFASFTEKNAAKFEDIINKSVEKIVNKYDGK